MLSARKAAPHAAGMGPTLACIPDTVPDWHASRRSVDRSNDVLHHRTIKWLATLPAGVRPIAAGRLYPCIVNRISDLWSQCEYTRLHFQSLLIDRRNDREAFPPEVKAELESLQRYYFEHISKLPALLWNAVPVNPQRIPDRIFAPHPDMEIDIVPL